MGAYCVHNAVNRRYQRKQSQPETDHELLTFSSDSVDARKAIAQSRTTVTMNGEREVALAGSLGEAFLKR